MIKTVKKLHYKYVFQRRVEVLAEIISRLLPDKSSVLDIGCGDGEISKRIMGKAKTVTYKGISRLGITGQNCSGNLMWR